MQISLNWNVLVLCGIYVGKDFVFGYRISMLISYPENWLSLWSCCPEYETTINETSKPLLLHKFISLPVTTFLRVSENIKNSLKPHFCYVSVGWNWMNELI